MSGQSSQSLRDAVVRQPPAAYRFDWSDLAFGSKKELNQLNATFIAAPRQLSPARFKQLIKQYLPQGHIMLGLAKEDYVLGFDSQPQFRMLRGAAVQPVTDQVNARANHQIHTLSYFQSDLKYILEKAAFTHAVFVNGSWKYSFHTQAPYYALVSRALPFELVSPFANEAEAREYEQTISAQLSPPVLPCQPQTPTALLRLAAKTAQLSFDYTFQTGAVLAVRVAANQYRPLAAAFNKIVPYQTYALHHGASRERHLSPPNDLNHYDTVHAEVELLIAAQKQRLNLADTALFINLMPCPTCARMLADTDITELVYSVDHSDGYAVALLETAGKTVRRMVTA